MVKQGLRQGDPLSPYLFALGMEYLSRCLKRLKEDPNFNFYPKCETFGLTHLMFADDLLLFSRADKISLKLLLDAFYKFSASSGLKANLDKSSIYLCGVNDDFRSYVTDELHLVHGLLLFRYLGVPLSSKRLSYNQCKPLVDKIMARTKSWTTRFLSYAGRLQLIKTVLMSMQNFWCQLFILPKKIIKQIQTCCRIFLWTGDISPSKKALVAWEKMCGPKYAGGLNIRHLEYWNIAAVTKLLWAISFKTDKLWVQWIHAYYFKGRPVGLYQQGNLSWMMMKILKCRQYVDECGGWSALMENEDFSISKMYKKLLGTKPKVHWKNIICHNMASPKSLFITWLMLHDSLLTTDKLIVWGIQCELICKLCKASAESRVHLFFDCTYSKQVWNKCLESLGVFRPVLTLDEEILIAVKMSKKNTDKCKLYGALFAEAVYSIWLQRNQLRFRGVDRSWQQLCTEIFFRTTVRCNDHQKSMLRM